METRYGKLAFRECLVPSALMNPAHRRALVRRENLDPEVEDHRYRGRRHDLFRSGRDLEAGCGFLLLQRAQDLEMILVYRRNLEFQA